MGGLPTGITSASFHAFGNTDVRREQLTISVRVNKIYGRASLITLIDTLSRPGALFEGKESIILRISAGDTNVDTNAIPVLLIVLYSGSRFSMAYVPMELPFWTTMMSVTLESVKKYWKLLIME